MGGGVLSNADHTLVMGVVNVTPDSFSDGGDHFDPEAAVRRGLEMWSQGVDMVDVGGESTRPGSEGVDADEEARRVLPVVAALASAGVVVSVDTSKAEVAAAALEAGAAVINDVTALGDPAMAEIVAGAGAGLILMHMRGTPRTMQSEPRYDDLVEEVRAHLLRRAGAAVAAGVAEAAICLDPGIGFGKDLEHNLVLLTSGVAALADSGHPVLVGASRKSFIDRVIGGVPTRERDPATVAAHTMAIASGASMIRVHDTLGGLRAARVADAIVRAAT